MNDPVALLLKFAFLAVLYLFVIWVARSSLRDLAHGTVAAGPLVDADLDSPVDLRRGVRPRLAVVASRNYDAGSEFDLFGVVTLGRGERADVLVEDPFASSSHLRIVARGSYNFIEDLGSTNGTFLNGRRLTAPVQLAPGDSITIGDTEFRYEE